jgi:hypothetical protein
MEPDILLSTMLSQSQCTQQHWLRRQIGSLLPEKRDHARKDWTTEEVRCVTAKDILYDWSNQAQASAAKVAAEASPDAGVFVEHHEADAAGGSGLGAGAGGGATSNRYGCLRASLYFWLFVVSVVCCAICGVLGNVTSIVALLHCCIVALFHCNTR